MSWPHGFGGGGRISLVTAATNCVANATNHVKGSYAQLTASLAEDCDGFYLNLAQGNNSGLSHLVDIAVGGAGSEQVIVANIPLNGANTAWHGILDVYIPIPIKKGTRISARCQSMTGGATVQVGLSAVAGGFYSAMRCGRATTYGANAAATSGTACDPGATINTKGAYAQLSAAISGQMKYAILGFTNQNLTRTTMNHQIDVAVGAAASEQIIIPDLYCRQEAGNDIILPCAFMRFADAKAGERLAVRSQSSNADATDRILHVVVIGFD